MPAASPCCAHTTLRASTQRILNISCNWRDHYLAYRLDHGYAGDSTPSKTKTSLRLASLSSSTRRFPALHRNAVMLVRFFYLSRISLANANVVRVYCGCRHRTPWISCRYCAGGFSYRTYTCSCIGCLTSSLRNAYSPFGRALTTRTRRAARFQQTAGTVGCMLRGCLKRWRRAPAIRRRLYALCLHTFSLTLDVSSITLLVLLRDI